MKERNQMHYLKLVKRCLEEIALTPKGNGARYLFLKKKAEKYLEKAKEFETIKKDVPPNS